MKGRKHSPKSEEEIGLVQQQLKYVADDLLPKIKIDSIHSIEKYVKLAIEDIISTKIQFKFRDKKQREAKQHKSTVCNYRLPFDDSDKTRDDVLEKLVQFLNLEDEKVENKENDDNECGIKMFGILGGSGTGKSHFIDYIVNKHIEKDKRLKKCKFIGVSFHDSMIENTYDSMDVAKGQYLGSLARRLLYKYFFDIIRVSNTNCKLTLESKLEAIPSARGGHMLMNNYSRFCTALHTLFELDYQKIICAIKEEITKCNKKMVIIVDNICVTETFCKLLKQMARLHLKVIVSSHIDTNKKFKDISPAIVEYHTIGGLNMTNKIIQELSKEANGRLELTKNGTFLLSLFGDNSRSFACFWYALRKDKDFQSMCCARIGNKEDKDIADATCCKDALERYWIHWNKGNFGPTDITSVNVTRRSDKNGFMKLISMYVLNIKKRDETNETDDSELPDYQYYYQSYDPERSTFVRFEREGIVSSGDGNIKIPGIMLYCWCQKEKDNHAQNRISFGVHADAVKCFSHQLVAAFETICDHWDAGAAVGLKTLLSSLIGLRLACAKWLRRSLSQTSPVLTLQNVVFYGNHMQEVLGLKFEQNEQNVGKQDKQDERKEEADASDAKSTGTKKTKIEMTKEEKWYQEKISQINLREDERINFDAIDWNDICEIVFCGCSYFGDSDPKKVKDDIETKTDDSYIQHCNLVEKHILLKLKNQHCAIMTFAVDNPSFNYLLKIPIKGRIQDIYMFIQCQSRHIQARVYNYVNNSEKEIQDKWQQFGAFLTMMRNTECFNKGGKHYIYTLFADFTLKNEIYTGVDCVEKLDC